MRVASGDYSALFDMKARVTLKYFVNDCLWTPFF